MNNLFIDRINLNNFRSYGSQKVGLFSKFNLIYGRNGSGKSSLLEAIEIALTGFSSRILEGSDLKKAVGNPTGSDFSIELILGEKIFAQYNSDNKISHPNYAEILKAYYGIDADGRKAPHLLRDMFVTHNLLYTERIIRFLDADNKNALYEVLGEAIIGRDAKEKWDRIILAKEAVVRFKKRNSVAIEQANSEVGDLKNKLKKYAAEDIVDINKDIGNIQNKLPVSLNIPKSELNKGLSLSLLKRLQNIRSQLAQVLSHIEATIDFERIIVSPSNWGSFTIELARLKKDVKIKKNSINEINKKIKTKEKNISQALKTKDKIDKKAIVTKKKIEKLNSVFDLFTYISDWTAEIEADRNSLTKQQDLEKIEIKIERLQAAQNQIINFPEKNEISKMVDYKDSLSKEIKKVKTKIYTSSNKIVKLKDRVDQLNGVINQDKSEQGETQALIKQIHFQIGEFLDKEKCANCPACGHNWGSIEHLQVALKKHQHDSLSKLKNKTEKSGLLLNKKLKLEKKYQELEAMVGTLKTTQSDLETKFIKENRKLDKINANLRNVFELLKSILPITSITKDSSLINKIDLINRESLSKKLREMENDKLAITKQLVGLWGDLRKDEYKREKSYIKNKLDLLKSELKSLKIEYPDIPKDQKEFEKSLKDKLGIMKNELGIIDKNLVDIELKINHSKTEIDSLNLKFIARENEYRENLDLLSLCKNLNMHIEFLLKLKIIKESEEVSPKEIYKEIEKLQLMLDGALSNLNRSLENKKICSEIRAQVDAKEAWIKKITNTESFTNEYLGKFKDLKSPDGVMEETWKMHEKTISNLFNKLHWPKDYCGIALKRQQTGLEIIVRLREDPTKEIPAGDRLSAGQRAALVISIFWALNYSSGKAPGVILMDEPVQGVDELNTLYFLDILRWIVEATDKQVFITTASQRIQSLIRKKFSYLNGSFQEIILERDNKISKIQYVRAA